MKYLLKLRFKGTEFYGFQVQPNKRTVQSTLQDTIEKLFTKRLDVKGCSRTDSGVHANVYYATFELPETLSKITCDKLPLAFNSVLPKDIVVLDAIEVSESFHVRHDVCYKEYVYIINNAKIRDPFSEGLAYYHPKYIDDSMLERMNKAGEIISGMHDFKCFMAAGSSVEDTVRNVKYVQAKREGDNIKIYVAADGFLYNMVRIIAGTLLDVAKDKIKPNELGNIINTGKRSLAGQTLPAHGLYLNKLVFRENSIN